MGLFFPEDPHFDETKWQTGFYRYRQLLSARFGQWWRINLLTLAGFKVYSKWTAEGFERFISEHNFQIRQTALLGGSLAPLCYLEASVQK